jgi:hypothetical protein
VPEPPGAYEPAVVDWLVGGDLPTALALPVTVIDLGRRGVLSLSHRDEEILVRRQSAAPSAWEAMVHELLFQRAGGEDGVSGAQLREWLSSRPEPARRWAVDWELALTQHALGVLRGELRGERRGGLLRRRHPARDHDGLRERWQEWGADLAERALVRDPHPDALAEWARILVLCVPLGVAEQIAVRVERHLSASERAALADGWCPLLPGASLAESLRFLLDALPAVPIDTPTTEAPS